MPHSPPLVLRHPPTRPPTLPAHPHHPHTPQEFDQAGWTRFEPHYIVWVCPTSYRGSDECKSQCTRRGRYCSPDPDGNLKEGYSGGWMGGCWVGGAGWVAGLGEWSCQARAPAIPAPSVGLSLTHTHLASLPSCAGSDVVQENLRQLCVFKLANETARPWVWWDYVTRFGQQCDMETKKYGQACAEKVRGGGGWSCCCSACAAALRPQLPTAPPIHPPIHPPPPPHTHTQQVFEQVNDGWSTTDKLRACIGEMDADAPHEIMEAQLAAQKGDDTEGEVRWRARARGLSFQPPAAPAAAPTPSPNPNAHAHTRTTRPPAPWPPPFQVFILPTIRINGVQYRGARAWGARMGGANARAPLPPSSPPLSCPPHARARAHARTHAGKMATSEVLRAICAGYLEGNRPQACDKAIDDACVVGGKVRAGAGGWGLGGSGEGGSGLGGSGLGGCTARCAAGCGALPMHPLSWHPAPRPSRRWPSNNAPTPTHPASVQGHADCAARGDGKTQCVPTFTGYNCTCGTGFIPHTEPDGSEVRGGGRGGRGREGGVEGWSVEGRGTLARRQPSASRPASPTHSRAIHYPPLHTTHAPPTHHPPTHPPLQTCLDINECLSISQLNPNCTCARCACKNTRGGYE